MVSVIEAEFVTAPEWPFFGAHQVTIQIVKRVIVLMPTRL